MEEQLQNDRQIAFHRVKLDYVQSPIDSLQFAFGNSRYYKMAKDIHTGSITIQTKTLNELNDDFRRSDFISLALMSSDILRVVIGLLNHQSDTIRELVIKLLKQICTIQIGRDQIIQNKSQDAVINLINDPVLQIRELTYFTLLNFSENGGVDELLKANTMEMLVDKLTEELHESIIPLTLKLINRLLYGELGCDQSLKTPVIVRLTYLLNHKNPIIRENACLCLNGISFNEKGKMQIIQEGCVVKICERLNDEQQKVRIAVTLCLSSLAQLKQGKVEIIQNNYFDMIKMMLNENNTQIQLNIIQLIASLAEHPEGRIIAQQCKQKLAQIQQDNSELAEYVVYTLQIINWVP